eukprot:6034842-Prymnesium_polylepis.1
MCVPSCSQLAAALLEYCKDVDVPNEGPAVGPLDIPHVSLPAPKHSAKPKSSAQLPPPPPPSPVPAPPPPQGFVKRVDSRFERNGRTFTFLGTNMWYGVHLAAAEAEVGGDRERLLRELDRIKRLGVKVIRVLACSEGDAHGENVVRPSLQPRPL